MTEILAVLSIIILVGCAANSSIKASSNLENNYMLGEHIKNSILVGTKNVPLNEGDWVVISTHYSPAENTGRIMLGLIFEDSLAAITIIKTNITKSDEMTRLANHPCKLRGGVYVIIKSKDEYTPECYMVASVSSNFMKEQVNPVRKGFQFVEKEFEADIPKTYIFASHFIAEGSDYLLVIRYWDSFGVHFGVDGGSIFPYASRAEWWHPKIVEAFRKR